MKAIKSISVPEPCKQPWELMDLVADGRHCESCCKTVVDFTGMSNDEIIKYFNLKYNVCGRFDEQQLNRVNQQLARHDAKPGTGLARWVTAAALFASTAFYKVAAQTPSVISTVKQNLSNTYPANFKSGGTAAGKSHGNVIKGRIIDGAGMPLAGATIRAVGTDVALPTDTDGRFELHLPKGAKQLMVSFIGFQTETVCIDSLINGAGDLKLTQQVVSMDGVMINPLGYTQRRTEIAGGAVVVLIRHSWWWRMYYKYIRTPIHNMFY